MRLKIYTFKDRHGVFGIFYSHSDEIWTHRPLWNYLEYSRLRRYGFQLEKVSCIRNKRSLRRQQQFSSLWRCPSMRTCLTLASFKRRTWHQISIFMSRRRLRCVLLCIALYLNDLVEVVQHFWELCTVSVQ